ncbi:type II toxin-antitoxin system HicA family toxin [Candidatus Micrarchaeota archaeon]|nr:type II toxin-antitoxin system HicA family toxin [Candidatus Micrarchaeota archaeon]
MPILSGKQLAKILCKHFGFTESRIAGSHLILKGARNGQAKTIPIPLHPEIGRHLLSRILKEAEISREEFENAL